MYQLELLLAYLMIAWKYNETRVFALPSIVKDVFEFERLQTPLDHLDHYTRRIILFEETILKELDYQIRVPFIFDIIQLVHCS